MKAEQCLTASYDWSGEPLNVLDIDGLKDSIKRVENSHERELVRCEDRVADYEVYWNTPTETVRIAAKVTGATYEVSDDTNLSDFE